MAEIPSDIASSAAQAGFKSEQVDKTRNAERAGQANAAKSQVKALDEVEDTVETTDDNTKVFSDAEGTGSQGRNLEEATEEPDDQAEPAGEGGITTDDDGHQHLDMEA